MCGDSSMMVLFLPIVIMILVMMFFDKRRQKKQEGFLTSLKRGDNVLTQGGIFGRVDAVFDNTAVVEVAKGVKVKVLKKSIVSREAAGADGASEDGEKAVKDAASKS
jgi:preprotein translocase subunit YajC